MIKQTLIFSNPVSLSLKYNQLEITFKDTGEIITRPIEDIGIVMIESYGTYYNTIIKCSSQQ